MLSVQQISKAFPGVQALSNMRLDVQAGEIHALVGENGAGKSTLTKIIAGVQHPDAGEMTLEGIPVRWSGPAAAKAAGVHVIYQEFVLFPHLSVAENIFIGQYQRNRFGMIDHMTTEREAAELMARLGVQLEPWRLVGELTVADQQMVEIAKALVDKPKLLILDEPTAVISGREVEALFERLRSLRDAGVAIVYISHRLEEIFSLCDRVTVVKDGHWIATKRVDEVDRDRLVTLMVGRDVTQFFPPRASAAQAKGAPVALRADDIKLGRRVRGVSIELRSGIVTGLAGMVGAGRSELAMAIFGGMPMEGGRVTIGERVFKRMTPAIAIEQGIGFVTEDRKGEGLAMLQDVATNISAASLGKVASGGLLLGAREQAMALADIGSFRIACSGPANSVATMSGGNQQKVLIARWAHTCRCVLILDEPTRGVDVGARTEIYRIMRELAARGVAILMISSELPEIVGMSDRVYVMREGLMAGLLESGEINEEAVVDLATQHRQAA